MAKIAEEVAAEAARAAAEDLGNGTFRYPDGSIRTADGKFAGSTGGNVGAAAEKAVWDQLATEGMDVVRGRIYTEGSGGQIRVYDEAVNLGDDQYLGIKVKSRAASLTPEQRAFDAWVDTPGNVATGFSQASGMDITGTLPVIYGP